MSEGFLRCGHCRGFYDAASSHCRYCGKDSPIKGAEGRVRVYPNRATCRAIQIAEFEQLPPESHEDPFRPDPEMLAKKCYCLHCGERGGLFEAVEMRWMVNEQMWACPCTTCGGRGFTFDIHLAARVWQCAECQHWYQPANGDYRYSNAHCPKCGCRNANGWFDDETDEEEEGAETGDLEQLGIEPEEELEADELPWVDSPEQPFAKADELPEGIEYVTEHPTTNGIPDDIEFPRPSRPRAGRMGPLPDDDIPG